MMDDVSWWYSMVKLTIFDDSHPLLESWTFSLWTGSFSLIYLAYLGFTFMLPRRAPFLSLTAWVVAYTEIKLMHSLSGEAWKGSSFHERTEMGAISVRTHSGKYDSYHETPYLSWFPPLNIHYTQVPKVALEHIPQPPAWLTIGLGWQELNREQF